MVAATAEASTAAAPTAASTTAASTTAASTTAASTTAASTTGAFGGGLWWYPRYYGHYGAWPYSYGYYPYSYGYSPYSYAADPYYSSDPGSGSTYDPDYSSSSYQSSSFYPAFPAQGDTIAHLTVSLPAEAEIWFEGSKMTATGSVREFTSPPLTPGKRYTYDVRASWDEKGHKVTQKQEVEVSPGAHVRVEFPVPPKTAGQIPVEQKR